MIFRPHFIAVASLCGLAGCTGLSGGLPVAADYERLPADVVAIDVDYLVDQRFSTEFAERDVSDGELPLASRVPETSSWSTIVDRSDYAYRIGAGDVLGITVPAIASLGAGPAAPSQSDPQQDAGYVVASDGTIRVPYVGQLRVGGLTVPQAQDLLVSELSAYIRSPEINLTVREFRSQQVLISGQVQEQGFLPVTDVPLSVFRALTVSGGVAFTRARDSVGRSQGSGGQGGGNSPIEPDFSEVTLKRGDRRVQIDVLRMARLQDFSQDYILSGGDVLYVPPLDRGQVFMLGEVPSQGILEITSSHTSLAQVIGAAGGVLKQSAKPSRIYVIRGDLTRPVVYHLNMKKVDAMLLADAFPLYDHDVVYVSEAGISRWNRFLDQLIPSIQRLLIGPATADIFND